MRIIDAKNTHPLADPVQHDAFELLPQGLPRLAFKIQRVNVLILFRWILGILNRAVGTLNEPLGMLLDVRMVG